MEATNVSQYDRSNPHGNTVINCKTRPREVNTVTIFPSTDSDYRLVWLDR